MIRAGQKKPFRKSTQREIDSRIDRIATCIARGNSSREIREICRREFQIEFRQTAEYIARARSLLADESGITREQARAESIRYWRTAMNDEKRTPRERDEARRNLDLIYGTHAPRAVLARVEAGGEVARELDRSVIEALELVYGKEAAQQPIEGNTIRQSLEKTQPGSIDPSAQNVKPRLTFI